MPGEPAARLLSRHAPLEVCASHASIREDRFPPASRPDIERRSRDEGSLWTDAQDRRTRVRACRRRSLRRPAVGCRVLHVQQPFLCRERDRERSGLRHRDRFLHNDVQNAELAACFPYDFCHLQAFVITSACQPKNGYFSRSAAASGIPAISARTALTATEIPGREGCRKRALPQSAGTSPRALLQGTMGACCLRKRGLRDMLLPLVLAVTLLAQAQGTPPPQPKTAPAACRRPRVVPVVLLQRPEHPREYAADKLGGDSAKSSPRPLRSIGPIWQAPGRRSSRMTSQTLACAGIEIFRAGSIEEAKAKLSRQRRSRGGSRAPRSRGDDVVYREGSPGLSDRRETPQSVRTSGVAILLPELFLPGARDSVAIRSAHGARARICRDRQGDS